MKIEVLVKPNAKHERIEIMGDGALKIYVNAPPVDGKANEAVTWLLARHFGVPKSQVALLRGERGKTKLFEIKGK